MLDVKRTSERLMVVRVIVGRSVRSSMVEKGELLTMLGDVVSGIDSGERLLICGELSSHVGSGIDGAHGGFGFGKRNVEDEMILEFADALNLAVLNTWFKRKRGDC